MQTSVDTSPLLERAFGLKPPSPDVLAALRSIYLWWDVDPQRRPADVAGKAAGSPHFLDGPFDLAHADAQELLQTLVGAYPEVTDLLVLAARAGLDVKSLDTKTTSGLSTRSLLDDAADSGKLANLIEVILNDPRTAAFHSHVRDVVGIDWLDEHGID